MKSFYELSVIAEEHLYQEDLQSFASALWSRFGQVIPGKTPQEKAEIGLDTVNTALDAAGIADPSGIADGVNTVIYTLRAASAKSADARNKHLFDALISLVSIIPFADFVKLLKARKLRTGAKLALKSVKPIVRGARMARNTRMANDQSQLAMQWGQHLLGSPQETQPGQPGQAQAAF